MFASIALRLIRHRYEASLRTRFCTRNWRSCLVRHARLERLLGISAPLDGFDRHRAHRLDQASKVMPVGYRCDVHHDQTLHAMALVQREMHRGLAAHAVSHYQGPRELPIIEKAHHVCCHFLVAHGVAMRGGAMITLIEGVDGALGGRVSGPRLRQLLAEPEQPVQDN